jgi:hypothetical protein
VVVVEVKIAVVMALVGVAELVNVCAETDVVLTVVVSEVEVDAADDGVLYA